MAKPKLITPYGMNSGICQVRSILEKKCPDSHGGGSTDNRSS